MKSDVASFRKTIWDHWKKEGRHELPWRKTRDAYKILVSEVMLQQTQVSRVLEKYKEFLTEFPTVFVLSHASLAEVLRVWSGLGYNRRGKYLHDAAKAIVAKYDGDINEALMHQLPGVGPYTRAAVRVFAYNEPHTMIETNIRTAFIHHFFTPLKSHGREDRVVSDGELVPLIEKAAEGQDPREWHWALMDYGAHLKRSGVRNNAKSRQYKKQSAFKGSLREVRGAILRELQRGSSSLLELPFDHKRIKKAAADLEREELIIQKKGRWYIA